MLQLLTPRAALAEDPGSFLARTWELTTVTPDLGDTVPSSGLCRNYKHTHGTYTHSGKAHTLRKKIL